MDSLQDIEQNVSRLVSAYEEARRDNAMLREQVHHLDSELFSTRTLLKQLQNDYKNLQVAHSFTVDSVERQKAKRHIQSLIADIDRTLEILKH